MSVRKMRRILVKIQLAAILITPALPSAAAPVFSGPLPYLSSTDSPFSGGSFSYFYLEDFEDGLLNVPGVTASTGWGTGISSAFTDSVDADDGVIDGSGVNGRSFFSNFGSRSVTFTFNSIDLAGSLPTHAGIAWTDVNAAANNRQVVFSAQDSSGNALGSIGPVLLGDNPITGQTAEDRFFGVFNAGGISSITISMPNSANWEVDHLQFGFTPVPLPAPGALLIAGLALLGTRLKRVPKPR